jgi:hypothetical protein
MLEDSRTNIVMELENWTIFGGSIAVEQTATTLRRNFFVREIGASSWH